MPRKTTVLILILATVTAVLLFLAISEGKKPQAPQAVITPTKKQVAKTARVFFSPQNIDLSSGTASPTSTVDLLVDTGNQEIVGVQVEAQYDPKSLSSLKLTPALDATSFFGPGAVVLFNDVNQTTGRISYAVAISPQEKTKTGIGKIATVSFSKAFNAAATVTSVNFLDKTIVTILGENESVLKESVPLNITLSNQTTAPFVPPATTQ